MRTRTSAPAHFERDQRRHLQTGHAGKACEVKRVLQYQLCTPGYCEAKPLDSRARNFRPRVTSIEPDVGGIVGKLLMVPP